MSNADAVPVKGRCLKQWRYIRHEANGGKALNSSLAIRLIPHFHQVGGEAEAEKFEALRLWGVCSLGWGREKSFYLECSFSLLPLDSVVHIVTKAGKGLNNQCVN